MKYIKIMTIFIVGSVYFEIIASMRTSPSSITYNSEKLQGLFNGLIQKDLLPGSQTMLQKGLVAGDELNGQGENFLHTAVRRNSLKIARSLITSDTLDMNQKNIKGQTPLHLAAKYRFCSMLDLLIDADVDLDVQDELGRTALHWACYDLSIDPISRGDDGDAVAKLLIASSANLDLQDEYGYTPLHVAVLTHRHATVDRLSDTGAKLDVQDNNKQTPLHLAVLENDSRSVDILLKAGADLDIIDVYEKTPHEYATDKKVMDVIKDFLEKA